MYPGIEGSDYINATFLDVSVVVILLQQSVLFYYSRVINVFLLQGYHQRDQYILTQGPLQNTVGDFWRMIWEYKVSCVTMLCQLQEKGVVSFRYLIC